MKTVTIFFAGFLLSIAFAFTPPKHQLVGKWSNATSSGEYLELKKDGTYNVYFPGGQIGEKGYYKLKHHVFFMKNAKDYVCGKGYWGKYKLEFHGDDSLHFTLIEDSCANRRYDIIGVNPGLRRMTTK